MRAELIKTDVTTDVECDRIFEKRHASGPVSVQELPPRRYHGIRRGSKLNGRHLAFSEPGETGLAHFVLYIWDASGESADAREFDLRDRVYERRLLKYKPFWMSIHV
jgi:hypothetical protein